MTEAPDAFLLSLFQKSGISLDSVEEAWERSEHLYPLLGWLTASFPAPSAFDVCAEWLRRCSERIDGAAPAAALFARARDEGPRQAHVVAGALGDARNQAILDGKPAVAAFADAASDLCEVWAAVTTNELDGETEAWARARSASTAMVTALLSQRGQDAKNAQLKAAARVELTGLLRLARAAVASR
ncbi:hypothetical protein [Comamonas sp. JC664]|uniref:hypothetical protein n=1 Tax=Comamonas sp. JC664 TaxID=2801917 RepID=UPI00174B60F2|nr:hypothetical protein [Comamonas sp. JC664]MBL0694037.1 hypothetical protein [Comamonas sp. JC664]